MTSRSKAQTDTELATAIKNSEATAFETLYFRYYGELKGLLRRKFRLSDEISRDLLQDTFSRLWEKRHTLDANKSIKAFLYRIAHNLAIDHCRKQGREAAAFEGAFPEAFEDESAELIHQLQAEIDRLPKPLRQIVILKWIAGYKYKEISQDLDISTRTVETRMAKALKVLVEKLRDFMLMLI